MMVVLTMKRMRKRSWHIGSNDNFHDGLFVQLFQSKRI